jgi:hypothetical protein
MPEPIKSLAARYYTDPQVFQMEARVFWQRHGNSAVMPRIFQKLVPTLRLKLRAKACLPYAAAMQKYAFSTMFASTARINL